jgi:hypothetical protein
MTAQQDADATCAKDCGIDRSADGLFGNVEDNIREAVLMATGRKLSPERLAETARAGLKEIFRH